MSLSGVVAIPEAAPIEVERATTTGRAIAHLYAKVNEIIRVLASSGYEDIDITFPSKPNEEVQIHHGLGRYPTGYWVVRKDRSCDVYDSSAGSWSKTTMRLACNVADAVTTVRVF